MRKNSIKNTRINMEVQRELSEIIRTEIKDPRVSAAMTSVVAVEVTPDLKYCKAYISVLGKKESSAHMRSAESKDSSPHVGSAEGKESPPHVGSAENDEVARNALAGLKSAVGYIRRELARRINLRNTPEISFVLDQSIEYGVNMSKLIDEVNRGIKGQEVESPPHVGSAEDAESPPHVGSAEDVESPPHVGSAEEED